MLREELRLFARPMLLTFDTVEQQKRRYDSSTEHPHPDPRILQDVSRTDPIHLILLRTTSQRKRRGARALDDVQPGRRQADEGKKETDTGTDGEGDGAGDKTREPLSETEEGDDEEDDSFEEDGG